MIYAKTELTEIPECCGECEDTYKDEVGYWVCQHLDMAIGNMDERSWRCPLVEVEE